MLRGGREKGWARKGCLHCAPNRAHMSTLWRGMVSITILNEAAPPRHNDTLDARELLAIAKAVKAAALGGDLSAQQGNRELAAAAVIDLVVQKNCEEVFGGPLRGSLRQLVRRGGVLTETSLRSRWRNRSSHRPRSLQAPSAQARFH